jgi:integrase
MDIFIDRSLCQTKEGLLFKGTKTDEPRKVGMPPSLLTCLEAHRLRQDEFRRQFGPAYRSDLDLIFANPDGSPLMPNSVTSTVSRLCRRLALTKGASLPVLQHSHASLLLANGVYLATVSERLGHSSVRTTADMYSWRGKRTPSWIPTETWNTNCTLHATGRSFIAQSHGIGMDYARKTYAHMPVGHFGWTSRVR